MNVLAFAATSSKHSINRQLLGYASGLITDGLLAGAKVNLVDLNDYEMPIYSIDRENKDGIPRAAKNFFAEIGEADGVLISFAEHNGFYTAAYKNIFDWASRIEMRVYQDTPTVMLATSIGKGGGANVLKTAVDSAPYFGNDLRGSMAIPSFNTNFDTKVGRLVDQKIDNEFRAVLSTLSTIGAPS